MFDMKSYTAPLSDVKTVVESEVKEWHFHIYFHQLNVQEYNAALALRGAVLKLVMNGAFVAVPQSKVHTSAYGPHPVGSYEIWVPSESFVFVFSYMCQNRGNLSVLVHPLTKEELTNHEFRTAWLGPPFPLDLSVLETRFEYFPLQYPRLGLGYSSTKPSLSFEERLVSGANVAQILASEERAAKFPKE